MGVVGFAPVGAEGAGGAISFRNPLIKLDIVERADQMLLAAVDVLEHLKTLDPFECAEVGAVGAFEAEVVALE